MKEPGIGQAEGAVGMVFEWITKFGLATVFAVILLGYVLWSSVQLSSAIMPTLVQLAASEERLATSQQDMGIILRQMQLQVCSQSQK